MGMCIETLGGDNEQILINVMRKANALFFSPPFATPREAEDPREVADFIATELRLRSYCSGTIQLHLNNGNTEEFGSPSVMWVDNDAKPTSDDDWLACCTIPEHWELRLPAGHIDSASYHNVKVFDYGPETRCDVDLHRTTQLELDRRELYEALHLE